MSQQQNKKREILYIFIWSKLFLEFMILKNEHDKQTVDMFAEMLQIVKDANESENLRGLRLILNDLLEMFSNIPHNQKAELNNILIDKMGIEFLTINTFRDKVVKQVLKAKTIKSDDEYYAVSSYVHDSDNQVKNAAKVEKLELIMNRYKSDEL